MSEIIRIKTINDVHRFFKLDGPEHPLISVIKIDDRITNFDYGTNRYIFDFYQINLKIGFSGSMKYGRNSYDFDEGTLTFIKPNQVIQMEPHEEIKDSSGWTLLFHPDLIRKSGLREEIEDYSFFDYDQNEALHLSEKEKISLTELVGKIEEEFQQNIDKHSQELIIANIELLLKYSKRFYERQFFTRTNLNKDVLTQFNKVLKDYYKGEEAAQKGVLTVSECSSRLNLSKNYLGDLIKSETGRSAKDHIQEYVVNLAKNKLLGTTNSVSEIAFSLGFEYPQGFNKLFKSKTGLSPSEYRTAN
ncbi:MAG: helix-turn-helix transcriptional regulator [Bacteroidota bacterium]